MALGVGVSVRDRVVACECVCESTLQSFAVYQPRSVCQYSPSLPPQVHSLFSPPTF